MPGRGFATTASSDFAENGNRDEFSADGYYVVTEDTDYSSIADVSKGKVAYVSPATVTASAETGLSDGVHIREHDGTTTTKGYQSPAANGKESSYRYGFNGKENDSKGEWGSQNHYDYGFRIYNPAVGKFLSVDPLASVFPWNSTYAFAEGSPISNIDLDGLEKYDFRYHMLKAGNVPALGLATYSYDWFTDKLIGGPVRAIEGAREFSANERRNEEYQNSREKVVPQEIHDINYKATKY